MTYYTPVLTLTLIDSATNKWRLKTEILYPAMETGRNGTEVVVGNDRQIVVDVVADSSFRQDHVVTSEDTITREPGETEVTVTVKKGGKKKGQAVVVYSQTAKRAA